MKEKILTLRKEGKSYREIKKILNCSSSTISYHCGKDQKIKSYERLKKSRTKPNVQINYILNRRYKNIAVRDERKGIKKYREPLNFSLKDFKKHILNHPYCYLTGEKIDFINVNSWQIDHIKPRSKKGLTELSNLKPVLKKANNAKSDLEIEEFLELCKTILKNHGYIVGVAGIEPAPLNGQ